MLSIYAEISESNRFFEKLQVMIEEEMQSSALKMPRIKEFDLGECQRELLI